MDNIPLLGVNVWVAAKYFAVVGYLVYLVFALVVVKQTAMMVGTLEVPIGRFIKYLSYAHLLFAIGVLALAFMVL
jgi:hypothetical protein